MDHSPKLLSSGSLRTLPPKRIEESVEEYLQKITWFLEFQKTHTKDVSLALAQKKLYESQGMRF